MRRKAEQGLYPSAAPPAYRNAIRDEQRIIEIDPVTGPVMREAFERYATGVVGLHELAHWAWSRGLRTRNGGKVAHTTLSTLLKRRTYCGDVDWGGVLVEGKHEALISRVS